MDSWEKFDETKLLPKEGFYNNLKSESISDEDYAHAQKLWDVLGAVFSKQHIGMLKQIITI